MSESPAIETNNALLVRNNALPEASSRLLKSNPDTMRANHGPLTLIAAKPGAAA